MSNHTPGPWGIKRVNYGAYHVGPATLERPSKEAIDYAAKSGLDLLARRTANAYLIAAAPDMLAALKLAEQNATDRTALAAIRAAIAKAQGGAV